MKTCLLRFCLLPLCLGCALGAESYPASEGHPIELWPEGVPGYRTDGPAETVKDGWVIHVRHPTLIAYLPPAVSACGTAVVFCPGGGYFHLPVENEECAEARWLNHLGIAAFVLTYRFGDDGPSAPLRDVLRAIRLVRSHATDYGIRPDRIGVMGASAGGHVATSAATLYDDSEGRTGSPLDSVSGRPDFTVLLYPVITMRDPYVHRGSRRGLLGANPSPELIDRYSTELHVEKDTPPAFLVSTQEDKSVPLENSVAYFEALRKAGVPAELHLFEKGPHGFRFTQGLGPTSDWPSRCEDWLRFHGWIRPLPVVLAGAGASLAAPFEGARAQDTGSRDWPVFNGDANGDHYSPLDQIDRGNVSGLRIAWKFDTGEEGGLETNPLVVAGVVYAVTPTRKVIALDAVSGKLIWKFDSGIPGEGPVRAVAYWTDGRRGRIFSAVNNFVYALNAADGTPIPEFGEGGRIDLRKDLGRDYRQQSITMTSPGVVYKDLIIVGAKEPEDHPAPPGDIRAYDVRTGALRWTFHTIPHPGEFGYDTWPKDAWTTAGAANNWAGMVVDAGRGIVYVPTGSAVTDWYGADRVGDDLFSDTLLALDASTGKRIWHFQGVHHDLWDRDFPAPPVLLTVSSGGRRVDAVAQTTKSGYVFLFDRTTGRPLFPVKESSYPASAVPGEAASPTQPLPILPAPFTRQGVTEAVLTNRTPEAHEAVLKRFKKFVSGDGGQFVPPPLNKLVTSLPGANGGGEWGGPAVDPTTGVLYVNGNETPRTYGLVLPPPPASLGERVYQQRCSACHGLNRAGVPPEIPSLIGIDRRLADQKIADLIHQGKGRMPPFADINQDQLTTLLRYLKALPSDKIAAATARPAAPVDDTDEGVENPNSGSKYKAIRGWFVDPDGYPAITPPWGTLSAIDMNTGKYLWKIPLGYYPELAAKGMSDTGTLNYGGPLVTGGGIVFISATAFDRKIRAFDSRNGKLLWEGDLPLPGTATPATYMVNGKQYVLIAAGGEGGGSQFRGAIGGIYVAFALP